MFGIKCNILVLIISFITLHCQLYSQAHIYLYVDKTTKTLIDKHQLEIKNLDYYEIANIDSTYFIEAIILPADEDSLKFILNGSEYSVNWNDLHSEFIVLNCCQNLFEGCLDTIEVIDNHHLNFSPHPKFQIALTLIYPNLEQFKSSSKKINDSKNRKLNSRIERHVRKVIKRLNNGEFIHYLEI